MKIWGIGALGFAVAIVACSSFGTTSDATANGGGDAGADGPGNLTGVAHAFDIALATDAAVVTGKDVSIPVTITRRGGATGASTITVTGLTDGVTAADITVQETDTTANLVISATAAAAQGARKLTIIGHNAAANDQVEVPLNLLVRGPSGTLDLTWGTQGVATLPSTINPGALAVQADGRLLVVNTAANYGAASVMTRLLSDGTPDPDFAGGQTLTTPIIGPTDAIIRTDAQGMISIFFATGLDPHGVCLVRVKPNGELDSSFRGDGGVTGIQEFDEAYTPHEVGQDRAGNWYTNSGDGSRRYSSAGKLDTAYGPIQFTGSGITGATRVGPDGSAVNLGILSSLPWHVTPTGSVTRGTTVFDDAAIDENGKVVATSARAIRRYASDITTVDATYAAGTLPAALKTLAAMTLIDDRLFVTGTSRTIGEPLAEATTVLAGYGSSGGPIPDFGTNGVATAVPGDITRAHPVRSSDGRIYAGGITTTTSFIVRYWL